MHDGCILTITVFMIASGNNLFAMDKYTIIYLTSALRKEMLNFILNVISYKNDL